MDSYNKVFKDVKKVLVVLAHPDDCEVVCGGTVARLIEDGAEVRLVVTTNGGKGMKDKMDVSEENYGNLRVREQFEGAFELGIKESENFNLNFPDGQFANSFTNIEAIVRHIREFKPDLVITHNPEDAIIKFDEDTHWVNHRDHRHTALVTIDACYPYSRDRGFFPEHFEKKLEPHKVTRLLLADSYNHPEKVLIETTEQIEKKRKALQKQPSGIDPESVEGYLEDDLYENDKYYECFRYIEIY